MVLKGHKRGIWDLAFSPVDKVLASAGGEGAIKVWNLSDGSCINTLSDSLGSSILKIQWINQGLQIVSGDINALLKIWNVKKQQCVGTFESHDDKVWALDVYNETLLSGGGDSKLLLWKDVTVEVEEQLNKEKMDEIAAEQALANMMFQGEYQDAAIHAFKLKKNRQFFVVMEKIVQ